MGGLLTDERPSLDRLKDLDALPDLETQLSVAHQLCTHSARAEMIARWLSEKLKASQEARSIPEAWEELLFTIRLLSPQRLAFLLGSTNLFDTISAALQNPECPRSVVKAITVMVNFLISVAASPDGLHVKAALSLPASIAALLLGLWLQNTARIAATQKKKSWIQAVDALLEPAFHLWNVRKPADDENAAFGEFCLAPAARLLALSLDSSDVLASNRKRRIEDEDLANDHVDALRSLLAKHVFMPARVAFFQTGSTAAVHPQRTGAFLPHHMSLEIAFQPYKARMMADYADGLLMDAAFPTLLDIAIRSISLSTPRRRTKEQPWVEAVFAALRHGNQDTIGASSKALIDMLKVIGSRSSLSRATLEGLVNSMSRLPEAEPSSTHTIPVDWDLIAQIVHLDAELFCRPDLAERLFKALTTECAAREGLGEVNEGDMKRLWIQRIAVPVMRAFAKSRKMGEFVKLWSDQLQQEEGSAVWMALDQDFQDCVEDSMTESALQELFARLATSVKAASESHNFGSSVIILNALLGGIRNESICIRLEPKCGDLFKSLFEVLGAPADPTTNELSPASHQPRIWALMLKAFEMWFPSWAVTQTDASPVSQRLYQWTTSNTVHNVLRLSQKARATDSTNTRLKDLSDEAISFVAGVWSVVTDSAPAHDTNEPAFSVVVDQTLEKLDSGRPASLLHHPCMLAIIDKDMRHDLVTKCMPKSSTENQSQVMAVLKQLAAVAVEDEQTETLQRLLDKCAGTAAQLDESVKSKAAASPIDDVDVEGELDVLDTLLSVPIDTIDEMHRKRLLDELCMAGWTSNHARDHQLQLLLGIIIRLLSRPNPTAQLLTEPSMIWRLALGVPATEYIDTKKLPGPMFQQAETLDLLEHVTLLVVTQVAANQQGHGRSVLGSLSREAQAMLSYVGRDQRLSRYTPALAVSRCIMQGLESDCKPDILHSLPHRILEVMSLEARIRITKAFTSDLGETLSLMATLERTSANYLEVAMRLTSLSRTLILLLDLWESTSKFVQPYVPRLASVIKHLAWQCEGYRYGGKRLALSAALGAVVSCYLLLKKCDHPKYGPHDPTLALELLDAAQLAPAQMRRVIEGFEEDLDRMSGHERLALVAELLEHEASTRSNLLLLHSCISKLTKDDTVGGTEAARSRLLPELVDTAVNNDGDLVVRKRAVACILTILKEKPFLVNQHSIEIVLASLPKLLKAGPGRSLAFFEVCRLVSALLLGHRARLHGRYHLVNLVFNSLLSALFDNSSASTNRPKGSTPFNQTHAHALSRLLVLFCEPAHLRRSSRSTAAAAGLVDESRKEQALVGRFVQYILHHYCDLVLAGSLGEGVREALTPGLWAVIDAVESSDSEGLKALSAAMNNNERAVLKGVYEEWKRFGKWRGG